MANRPRAFMMEPDQKDKPLLQLAGKCGNSFAVFGRARQAARREGWTEAQIQAFTEEAMSSDYNQLIRTCHKYFKVQ